MTSMPSPSRNSTNRRYRPSGFRRSAMANAARATGAGSARTTRQAAAYAVSTPFIGALPVLAADVDDPLAHGDHGQHGEQPEGHVQPVPPAEAGGQPAEPDQEQPLEALGDTDVGGHAEALGPCLGIRDDLPADEADQRRDEGGVPALRGQPVRHRAEDRAGG